MCFTITNAMFVVDWTDYEQMVAQEWIRRDSYNTCLGRWCRCCPYGCYKRTMLMMFYVFCISLGFFMLLFVTVMGEGLVKPYVDSLSYHNTSCKVVSPLAPLGVGCRCNTRCRAPFPCPGVYVMYVTDDGVNVTALLRRSETSENCHHDKICFEPHKKEKTSRPLDPDLEPGDRLDCLFNPANPQTVIRVRNSSGRFLFHLLFWPCLLLVFCLGTGFSMVHVCGCKYIFVRRAPEEIRAEAERRDPFRHLVDTSNHNSFANMNYTPDPSDIISLKQTEVNGMERLYTP